MPDLHTVLTDTYLFAPSDPNRPATLRGLGQRSLKGRRDRLRAPVARIPCRPAERIAPGWPGNPRCFVSGTAADGQEHPSSNDLSDGASVDERGDSRRSYTDSAPTRSVPTAAVAARPRIRCHSRISPHPTRESAQ